MLSYTDMLSYTEVSYADTKEIREDLSLLIVTATPIETWAVHNSLKPFPGYDKILQIYYENQTYYIGVFGAYAIIHVQCEMGSSSRESSIITVINAIDCWKPKAIVMVGIAFGSNAKEQNIGDVLVSEAVFPYDIQRVGKETINRGHITPSGVKLLNRFKNIKGWKYVLPYEKEAKIFFGTIICGESLVDNLDYKKDLLKACPYAKGGDMESYGVCSSAESKNLEWIIIKGICDYGDGNKFLNKEENQKVAAEAATSLCLAVFLSKCAFDDLNFSPIREEDKNIANSNIIIERQLVKKVLFEVYSREYDDYYLVRQKDYELQNDLNFFDIWISGPSGSGKTCSILRNLIRANKEYRQILLGVCSGYKIEKLFYKIYSELLKILEPSAETSLRLANIDLEETIGKILDLLQKHFNNKKIYVLIEEIPVDSIKFFKKFVQSVSSLLINRTNNYPCANIKFIFSTIQAPKEHIPPFQKKVCQYIKFVDQEYWEEKEMEQLLSIITNALNINFSNEEKRHIIIELKGLPRLIKHFVQYYIDYRNIPAYSIDRIIQKTKDQLL